MKALKEKRISLRSLWRRGLVILSLFALVFASCGDNGGSDDKGVETEKITKSYEVSGAPAAKQYEGTNFDFGTLKVTGEYTDGTTFEFTPAKDPKRFAVTPKLVQGAVLKDNSGNFYWAPVTDYTVSIAAGTEPVVKTYTAPTNITVVPIQRGQNSVGTLPGSSSFVAVPIYYGSNTIGLPPNASISFLQPVGWKLPSIDGYVMNSALNLTGDLQQTAYVDQIPNKASFRLQATYVDLQKKDIPLENAIFEVRPYYSGPGGLDRSVAGPGDLLVTVGKNDLAGDALAAFIRNTSVLGWVGLGVASLTNGVGREAGMLTAMHPYDKVYHVARISLDPDIDAVASVDTLPFMYYWEADSSEDWKTRLKDVGIKIEYVGDGGAGTRTVPISSLGTKNDGLIWWNANPYDTGVGTTFSQLDYKTVGIQGVRMSSTPANKLSANPTGLAFNKITEPIVKINYRGAVTEIPVDVGIKVESITATYKSTATVIDDYIEVNVKPLDNDVAGQDALWYSKQLDVVASVATARGATAKSVTLTYAPVSLDQGLTFAQAGIVQSPSPPTSGYPKLQYTMDFGLAGDKSNWDTTGWGQSNVAKNDNNQKVVTFYFNTPISENSAINNTTTSKKLKAQLNVLWKNIRAQ